MRQATIPLGPFDLVAPIGRGGMGEVWRAVHREQEVAVAVKLLTRQDADAPGFRAAVHNEVRAAAGLDHPHIIRVLDFGEVSAYTTRASQGSIPQGAPYLAMEYADGGSLTDRRGRVSWRELRELLLTLLAALAHAHARGVIHRDLKPSNVLQGGLRPGLKLTDFGMAHALEAAALPEGVKGLRGGTPAYMAPEQFEGRWRDYGPWTDLYALGCLAWALTTGSPPFGSLKYDAARRAHLERAVPRLRSPTDLPEGFEEWLRRLLHKDPTLRYQRAADAAWALRLMGEPVTRGPTPSPVPPPRRTRDPITLLWAGESEGGRANLPVSSPADVPPMPASWRADGPQRRATKLAGAGLGLFGLRPTPLVGREKERDQLWDALRRVSRDGHPRLLALGGPAGFGKTRLAEWLCRRAHETGSAEILKLVHGPMGGPEDGLRGMVTRLFRCGGLAREDVLARLEELLRARGVEDPWEWHALTEIVSPATEADQARGVAPIRLRNAWERHALVARVIKRVASTRPLVVWMDSVQWGTESLVFASRLVQDPGNLPVLVLLTIRDEAVGPEAADLLERVLSLRRTRRLDLGPLSEEHRLDLVEEMLGLEKELAVQVMDRTGGNPQFAAELVGDWVARGVLELGEGGYRLREGIPFELPDSLHDVWEGRVAKLLEGRPEADGLALELAAALGQSVNVGEWHQVCAAAGITPSTRLVDSLLDQRLARAPRGRPGSQWSFAHAMVRESVERRAAEAGRRASHHELCARVVSQLSGSPERLGRHLAAAGRHPEALEALLEAATQHLATGDLRDTEVLLGECERTLSALDLGAEDARFALARVLRAQTALALGHLEEAETLAAEARDLARTGGWDDLAVQASFVQARLSLYSGRIARGIQHIHDLLDQLGDGLEARRVAECRRDLGTILVQGGRLDEARQQLLLAHQVLGQEGEEVDQGLAALGLAGVELQAGDLDASWGWLSQAVEIFEQYGSRYLLALGDVHLGEHARARGDVTRAAACYADARDRLAAMGSREREWPEVLLAVLATEEGRLAEARSALEGFLEGPVARERRDLELVARAWLLVCAAGEWDWDEWDLQLAHCQRLLSSSGLVKREVAQAATMAAESALEAGEVPRARQALELSLEQWTALGSATEAAVVAHDLEALG